MIVVFNPVAGRRRAALLWRVLDVMVANGMRMELAETRRPGHAEALARQAVREGAQLVVAAGGDGTIAEVASGVIGSPARLGIIPLGTANVLANDLGLPFAPRAVAAALAFGRTRLLWPGLASGSAGQRLFVQMLGIGFDAQVVHTLPVPLKRATGRGAYVLQSLRELTRYGFEPVRLRIDGAETEAATVIISKGRLYGGPYMLAPDARHDRPGFSVVLFDHGGPLQAMICGAALPLGLLGRLPGVRHARACEIDVIGNTTLPVQTDGDAAGMTPLRVTDAPAPIPVVVGQ